MERFFCKIIFLLCLLLFVVACGEKESNGMNSCENDKDFDEYDISEYEMGSIDGLSIEILDVSNSSIRLCLKNNSDNRIGYGEWYAVETKKADVWIKCQEVSSEYPRTFVDILHVIGTDSEVIKGYHWKDYYDELPPGDYRILFEAYLLDESDNSGDRIIIGMEFQIE